VTIFLGLITETVLVVALSRRYGKRLACYILAMLCLSSGCFFASFLLLFANYIADVWLFQLGATLIIYLYSIPDFLPSSFSIYAVTLSSAHFLLEKYAGAVSVLQLVE